ncbi:myocardin-related transcription factor B isoform X2 [Cheilinus undulatus]|uniref:myocardin-related transcription factor B isoform X2 n=1 Tax=Cheilinus undulatus TaxID=241271 RepID=UPI001BD44898|nr:myocardin-related transcription factor B isoform X2 [Cheilinus undulatus]
MGLQTWLPSEPSLSCMACLDVETPSIYRVLQLCLQQRRNREQLVDQGIMPPLKTPATFHEQIRSLERARTGNFLKHKLCNRPERAELIRMHILQETPAEPSLQAKQMKLKRARLADDLNEKIAQRPGPMELVEKNILPVDSAVEEVNEDSKTNKQPDIYNFDEDDSDSFSPRQPDSQQSPSSACTSPAGSEGTETMSNSSQMNSPTPAAPANSQSRSDVINVVSTNEQQVFSTLPINTNVPSLTPGPILVKQSLPKLPSEKSRSKRSKETKPRVKKLKYHQYIPPDQKQELNEVPMDSAYARLLQQQQQFLQLQILSQQQQQYNYQTVPPATPKPATEVQSSCSSVALSGNSASTSVQPRHNQTNHRPDHLPANLDEMKVAELKMELKLRSLPVSGPKTDLIERLKLFQENSNIQTAAASETIPAACQSEITKLTPPVSPIASKVSSLGIEDCNVAESPIKISESASPRTNSPQKAPLEERLPETGSYSKDSEKDKRLHEKERQIEELMRRLEQEQKLVEELKMLLEVEKRSQQGDSPQLSPLTSIQVKEENMNSSDCCSPSGLPVMIKQEEAADQSQLAPQNQFIISHQTKILLPVKTEAQILLPASFPANSIKLHTTVSSAATGLLQTSGQTPQKTEASAALQQCRTQSEPLTKSSPISHTTVTMQQTKSSNLVSKCKDPPRYEDAVKQTRSMQTAIQGPTAASQQMDDLFDVLIESGEISPFTRQDPPILGKPLPVTASVTTLPINTVLSRPPPLVQVAQLPTSPLNPSTNLAALVSDPQLETLLDSYHTEPQTLKLIEELHSPVVAMEVDLNESTNMDNMDWLDLTLSVPGGGVNPLDMSTPAGVFSSDFLNSHELHLNWD